MFFDKYPYTYFHELNLDWLLKKYYELKKKIDKMQKEIDEIKKEVEE